MLIKRCYACYSLTYLIRIYYTYFKESLRGHVQYYQGYFKESLPRNHVQYDQKHCQPQLLTI